MELEQMKQSDRSEVIITWPALIGTSDEEWRVVSASALSPSSHSLSLTSIMVVVKTTECSRIPIMDTTGFDWYWELALAKNVIILVKLIPQGSPFDIHNFWTICGVINIF